MTDMYRVRVLAVEGNRLICRVTVDYPGEGLNPSRTLAFRIVWEPWYDLYYRVFDHLEGDGRPTTAHEASERARHSPLTKELANQNMNDLDWCAANAGRFINCVGVTDRLNYPESNSGYQSDAPPQATYTITVTDPGWLAHLNPGLEWGTTGFDDDGWTRVERDWLTPTVVQLVAGIVTEDAFDRLPILADALQDAGCDCDAILNHFRDPTATHVRGCWALDLVLEEM